MPLYTLTIPHSQSDTHYHLYLLWWWNQRKSRPQDLFSCLFYDSLSFTASCCHCLLLPLPLAVTVCHCLLLFSCCAVLCCLNSKERILIALEDTRNLKIYVKVFGTSQKWKAFTTPKQHRICIKELDLPLLDLPLVESFTFTYNSLSLSLRLSHNCGMILLKTMLLFVKQHRICITKRDLPLLWNGAPRIPSFRSTKLVESFTFTTLSLRLSHKTMSFQ